MSGTSYGFSRLRFQSFLCKFKHANKATNLLQPDALFRAAAVETALDAPPTLALLQM